MAQLVGCWTYNPRVVGSTPSDANCFMWDNILVQDVNLVCASLHPGEIWVPNFKGYWLLRLAWQQQARLPRLAILAGVILCKTLSANNRKLKILIT